MRDSTTIAPDAVEIQAPQKQWQGQSVPRKEDRRLTQGEGVFVDVPGPAQVLAKVIV